MKSRFQQIFDAEKMTAGKFADLVGVSQPSVSNVTTGRNKPSVDMLEKIARVFPDINLRWLITGDGEMYAPSTSASSSQQELTLPFSDGESVEKRPVSSHSQGKTAAMTFPAPPSTAAGSVKRIVLFFDDGHFEDYHNG
jgi:transcriptional regulator with XRE-family HTH domain